MKRRVVRDVCATEMIPIRMIVSIVIIAAVLVLLVFGYRNYSISMAEHQVKNEINTVLAELSTMVASGVARDIDESGAADGTQRVHRFVLPDSLQYLSFGVDPDPDSNGVLSTGLTENGSMICYQVQGSSKQVQWLSKTSYLFREGVFENQKWDINDPEQGFIFTSGGTTTVTFELVQHKTQVIILIQGTDTIDQ